jgi:hypothetical protein
MAPPEMYMLLQGSSSLGPAYCNRIYMKVWGAVYLEIKHVERPLWIADKLHIFQGVRECSSSMVLNSQTVWATTKGLHLQTPWMKLKSSKSNMGTLMCKALVLSNLVLRGWQWLCSYNLSICRFVTKISWSLPPIVCIPFANTLSLSQAD